MNRFQACFDLVPKLTRVKQVPVQDIPWPVSGLRRASINSFGYGGSNAHLILDDALHYLQSRGLHGYHHCTTIPPTGHEPTANGITHCTPNGITYSTANGRSSDTKTESSEFEPLSPLRLLIWSAADAGSLQRMTHAYQDYYQAHIAGSHDRLNQLAYTLVARRSVMSWRTFAIVGTTDSTVDKEEADGSMPPLSLAQAVRAPNEEPHIAFIFTGQGAQYAGMGLELLKYPVYAESLQRSNEILASLGAGWSIVGESHLSRKSIRR